MSETPKKPRRKECKVAVKTLRDRLRDRHGRYLSMLAREVNFVWNYCNELSMQVLAREGRFLSAFDFHEFTRGASKEGLHLHSQTIQAISEQYVENRVTAGKRRLAWRASSGARRALRVDSVQRLGHCNRLKARFALGAGGCRSLTAMGLPPTPSDPAPFPRMHGAAGISMRWWRCPWRQACSRICWMWALIWGSKIWPP